MKICETSGEGMKVRGVRAGGGCGDRDVLHKDAETLVMDARRGRGRDEQDVGEEGT